MGTTKEIPYETDQKAVRVFEDVRINVNGKHLIYRKNTSLLPSLCSFKSGDSCLDNFACLELAKEEYLKRLLWYGYYQCMKTTLWIIPAGYEAQKPNRYTGYGWEKDNSGKTKEGVE